jgi:hypothetical protein
MIPIVRDRIIHSPAVPHVLPMYNHYDHPIIPSVVVSHPSTTIDYIHHHHF